MIPRFRPALGLAELGSAFVPGFGNDVARFEVAFARWAGQKQAVAFPYGRTAQIFLLEALGLHGREIVMPAYTCVVVAHAVVLSGNEPVFVDCAADSANMDLQAARNELNPRTGALIATSIYGEPVDLDRLGALQRSHPDLVVLQDCAHGFAAEWNGQPVQRAGRAAFYGLNVSKLLTSVFGGMVTTDDEALATRLRSLRDARLSPAGLAKTLRRFAYLLAVVPAFHPAVYSMVDWLRRRGWLDRLTRYYDEGTIDMPGDYLQAMTNVEARVGITNLKRWDTIVAAHRLAAAHYQQSLGGNSGFGLPRAVPGHTYSHFAVRTLHRDAVIAGAHRAGVELGALIEYNIPDMAAYRQRSGYRDCPHARARAAGTINLPVYSADPTLNARVIDSLRQTVS